MTDKAQIFLIAPPITDVAAALERLGAACATGDVAAIVLSFATSDEREQIRQLKAIAPALQKAGTAVLVAASPSVAARGGADGVHVAARGEAVDEAVDALKPERIVGVGGLHTRHEAMTIGEADIDYLLFGEPFPDGGLPDFETTLERVGWWAEIFAVPCVGFAPDLDSVGAIAATGAEFVGLGHAVWSHADGPAAAIAQARAIIDTTDVGDDEPESRSP
ncbi:thiamine phosphate synthase [Pseudochelatococcus sp. B33]